LARRDLSRTVIEGGRYYRNSWDRRASHGVERASTREWLDRISDETDDVDDSAPPPRPKVYKSFRDKLGPAQRWLAAQANRPWTRVYSELRARFDSRTIAGRHVVEDHMLDWVHLNGRSNRWPHYRQFELVVDAHGILRKPRHFGRTFRKLQAEVSAWAAGRKIATHAGCWFWFQTTAHGKQCAVLPCSREHFLFAGLRYHAKRTVRLAPLTRGELRYLARIPEPFRRQVVIADPLR
jgi:hypothetical protein